MIPTAAICEFQRSPVSHGARYVAVINGPRRPCTRSTATSERPLRNLASQPRSLVLRDSLIVDDGASSFGTRFLRLNKLQLHGGWVSARVCRGGFVKYWLQNVEVSMQTSRLRWRGERSMPCGGLTWIGLIFVGCIWEIFEPCSLKWKDRGSSLMGTLFDSTQTISTCLTLDTSHNYWRLINIHFHLKITRRKIRRRIWTISKARSRYTTRGWGRIKHFRRTNK